MPTWAAASQPLRTRRIKLGNATNAPFPFAVTIEIVSVCARVACGAAQAVVGREVMRCSWTFPSSTSAWLPRGRWHSLALDVLSDLGKLWRVVVLLVCVVLLVVVVVFVVVVVVLVVVVVFCLSGQHEASLGLSRVSLGLSQWWLRMIFCTWSWQDASRHG